MVIISIVASGTRGDVQPYIALGIGLKAAGHQVRLLTNENFEPMVTEAGLDFFSIGKSIEAILENEEWHKVLESSNFLRILRQMQTEMKQQASYFASVMPDLVQGSDLIIAGAGGISGVYTIANLLNIPMIQAFVFPFTPTAAFPSPLVPNLPAGGIVNRLSFHITRQMFWQSSKTADVATREILGAAKAPFWGPYKQMSLQKTPVLYGYSRHVLPHPADWPAHHVTTGYWFLDTYDHWTPPADLVEFLNAGDAPVYIGFGSMRTRNPEEAGAIALEALAISGQRGIIASGWGGLKADRLPESIHPITSIPHSWLFPQMAAVVHHGGAGTTAAGLAAGVPSVIIPFMGDQPFWGKRVADLGVGPTPIPRKKLTAQQLADAITEAVTNHAMRQRARTLGENIRAEDGIASAIQVIERVLHRTSPQKMALI